MIARREDSAMLCPVDVVIAGRRDATGVRRGGPTTRREGAVRGLTVVGSQCRRTTRGLTLVELLVAAALACGLLAAAWGWVWTTAAAARRADAGAQTVTAQAFATRMLRADLAACAGLCPPALGVCGPTRLAVLCRDPLSGDEKVTVVAWDPARRVVWRNASGSYLAERVTAFRTRYFAADGEELSPVDGVLGLEARAATRRVVVTWTTEAGETRVEEDLP